MTLRITEEQRKIKPGVLKPKELQRRLNVFSNEFRERTGRDPEDIELLHELKRMGYEAYLTDEEG